MFFCEQMFLTKLGNEHTCESAIYTHQNTKLIQQKCNQEYYPNLNPEPELLNTGNYLLLGNFPLPWNYQVQERACPTRTYACLAKHYSKQPIGAPRLNLVPASPKLYKVVFHNVLVFLS